MASKTTSPLKNIMVRRFLIYIALMTFSLFMMVSCSRSKTKSLLLNKKWEVYDVTPPSGNFNIEQANRAQKLENGFYKDAWFKFLPDSVFIASFNGKADTGKYHLSINGKTISLYPKHGNNIYEQIKIRHLSANRLSFNTVVADFHLILHLKAAND